MLNHNINNITKVAEKKFTPEISICELLINPVKRERRQKLEIYNNDIKLSVIENKIQLQKKKHTGGGKRNNIIGFSKQSSKRLKFHMNNTSTDFKNMITLTYPKDFPSNGREVKYHLNRFTKELKKRGINYTWVIEFQKRGAPHFHFLTDKRWADKYEISLTWFNIVNSRDQKHLKAGTKVEKLRLGAVGAKSYIRKYVNKQDQKEVPKEYNEVGRFWGNSKEEYKKEVYEIDENEAISIKNFYEIYQSTWLIKKGKPKEEINFDWLYDSKNVTLWSFAKELKSQKIKFG